MHMSRHINILIADRNRNIRELFTRELTSDNFHVIPAKNTDDIFRILKEDTLPDLMVIDPDLTDSEGAVTLRRLREITPKLPVIVHSYRMENMHQYDEFNISDFIIKEGNSIEYVKKAVLGIIEEFAHGL